MFTQTIRNRARVPYLLIVIGILLRLGAINHGFPDVNEEATPVRQAWEMWDWQTNRIDFNPKFFNYPALSFYVNWIAQAIYRIITEPTGLRVWGPSQDLPLDLVLIGRLLGIASSAGIAWATYGLARRYGPAYWAVWTAAFVFWMPTIFHYSLLSVVDLPLAFFSTLVLRELIVRPAASMRLRKHLWIGLLIGLTASCKYTGALLAVPYLLTHLATNRWDLRTFAKPAPWMAGLVAITVFLGINPYMLLDYETFYWNFAFEQQHMAGGHFGREEGAVVEYGRAIWQNAGPSYLYPPSLA